MFNHFRELHPVTTTTYYCIILIFVMIVEYSYKTGVIFLFLSVQFLYLFGMKKFLKQCQMAVPMIFIIALFNVIFNHRGETPFLYVNDVPLTLEALLYGCNVGIMITTLFLWVKIFGEAVDNQKIMYLIGNRFPVTALMISMIICYYDRFIHKIDRIQEVWHSFRTEQSFGYLKHAGIILSVLLTVMLEDSVDTALSMKARGYGKHKRTQYKRYHYSCIDAVIGVFCLLQIVSFILLPASFLYVFCTFLMIPVIFNAGKEAQWKFYQSKI